MMMPRTKWTMIISEIVNHYQECLISNQEFEDDVKKIIAHQDSPIVGLTFILKNRPFDDLEIGVKQTGNATYSNTFEIPGNRPGELIISLWYKPSSKKTNYTGLFQKLFEAFWKPNIRVTNSGLITIQNMEDGKKFAQSRLDETISQQQKCSVIFLDLDNFKAVNTRFGMPRGNQIIQQFGSLLERLTKNRGIPLNNGGDEFVILYPNGSYENSLLLAFEINNAIDSPEFTIEDVKIGVSVGIDANINFDNPKSITTLVNNSETVMKDVKQSKKGLTRIFRDSEVDKIDIPIVDALNLSLCITKCGAFNSIPYQNIWLNAFSNYLSQEIQNQGFSCKIISDCFKKYSTWVDFTFDNRYMKTTSVSSVKPDIDSSISQLDLCIAATHGIFNAHLEKKELSNSWSSEKTFIIKYNTERSEVALELSSGETVFTNSTNPRGLQESYNFGYIPILTDTITITPKRFCVATLIKIGHDPLPFPKEIFDEIIVVDDRPVKGGGLPDFWELTIARLISELWKNPNITEIFVIGNQDFGSRTITQLQNTEDWNEIFIHKKTGIPIQIIRDTKQRLRNIIKIVDNNDLLKKLADILRERKEIFPTQNLVALEEDHRFLRRDLNLEKFSLTNDDGCKVETIREAYPIMLEIARNPQNTEIIVDQAGQQIHELIDFKVLLKNPLKKCIPDFYTNEEEYLKKYFKNEFLDTENGLFGKVFKENDQLVHVLKHSVDAITRNPHYATRRSILVVPHKTNEGISPLGLVSIRIISRFDKEKIILNYSFTWRSVEALVGFPYSLYGSVMFSEYLTSQIKSMLPEQIQNHVEMGFVSYIAHSLHLFSDEYSQNIARSIISDASL